VYLAVLTCPVHSQPSLFHPRRNIEGSVSLPETATSVSATFAQFVHLKMPSTTWLITGANRGIGKGVLSRVLARPNTTVVAGLRDTSDTTAKDLREVPTASGSKVIVVKIDASSDTDARDAVELLQSQYGIHTIDVVIANSGILDQWGPVSEVTPEDLRRHFEVNTIGPIKLFQATKPLLEKSENPRFYTTSSSIASIGIMDTIPMSTVAYGLTKCAANYAISKIHFENPRISAVALHPGWVQTRMGHHAANLAGVEKVAVTIEDSAIGLIQQVSSVLLFILALGLTAQ
jgi:norsolorinic acid ketoreductase